MGLELVVMAIDGMRSLPEFCTVLVSSAYVLGVQPAGSITARFFAKASLVGYSDPPYV